MLIGFASTVGGCAHYRAELPARQLAARGWDTCWTDGDIVFGSEGGMGLAAPQARFSPSCSGRVEFVTEERSGDPIVCPDVIVIAAGWVRCNPLVIERAQANGQRIVADCDDWPWLPPENPHRIQAGEHGEEKLATMRAADACTVSTQALWDLCSERGIAATICRNVIDPSRYFHARTFNELRAHAAAYNDEHVLTVGYRGMLCGFHDADVATLQGCLPTEGVRYVHVGADPRGKSFAEVAGLPPELVEDRQAVDFADYPSLLGGIDLALIPFARRPFSQAKSNIAGLEWTAAGVPWIASPQPEYTRLDWGAEMRKPSHWRLEIDDYQDPEYRADGLHFQRKCADLYAVDAPVSGPADAWESVFRALTTS